MSSEKSTMRTLRDGLLTISAATLLIALALGNTSVARAQSDDTSSDQPQQSYAVVPDVTPSDGDPNDAAAQAQAASDAADEAVESATEERDQLESDGASEDQIDAANQAVAQARAQKQAAFQAAQTADQPQGDAQDQGQNK